MANQQKPPTDHRSSIADKRSQEEAIQEFKVEFLKLALEFGHLDIKVARELTTIIELFRASMQENPGAVLGLAGAGRTSPGSENATPPGELTGGDFASDIMDLIKKALDFFLGDKDFFLSIIKLIVCGC